MAIVTMKQLLESGVHFGHQSRRWNPKMKKFIFGERNGVYIIDLQKTIKQVNETYHFIRECVEQGGDVLFVGTKRQAQEVVREQAQRCGMYYVTNRWLGGTLTNFDTIKKSIRRLKQIEKMEEEGDFGTVIKKEINSILKDKAKLEKNLSGHCFQFATEFRKHFQKSNRRTGFCKMKRELASGGASADNNRILRSR